MVEGKWRFCLQNLQYCYITMLWKYGLNAAFLELGTGEMAGFPAIPALLIYHSDVDT
jgi:hypothetical protein